MHLTVHGMPANSGVLPNPPVPRRWAWAAAIGAFGLIFLVDHASGLTVVHHLYHVPIIFAVSSCTPVLAGMSFPAGTLSVSVGIACRVIERRAHASAAEDDAEGEVLFGEADAALYAAKGSGRNRVVVAEPGAHEGLAGAKNHERTAR